MKHNKLSIKNFGPIKSAYITISPLTIFIGQNSSGKSFSAILIHSLLNSFNKLGFSQHNEIRNKSIDLFNKNNSETFKEFKEKLNNYLNKKPKINDESLNFPIEKLKIILKNTFGEVYTEIIEENLKGNFKNNLNKLNRLNKDPFEFEFESNKFINKNGKLILNKYTLDISELKNKKLLKDEDNICKISFDENFISINLNYILWENFFENEMFCEVIFMMIVSDVMDCINQNSFYIPATGDELFKDINSFISKDIENKFNPSIVQKELLINFLNIKSNMKKGPFHSIAEELENELLGGEIQIKRNEVKEELSFIDRNYDVELDFDLTSASVRELTPLIIYLKYFLKKDDTLIIEEPENHIHPQNQLVLVKYLVKAINQGLKIIITTHSDYIVEKFNNFIRLGNAKEEIFTKLNYNKSNILNYNDVNIYNFKKEDKYSYIAHKIEINETGFDEDSFYEVNSELYDESTDIIDAKLR